MVTDFSNIRNRIKKLITTYNDAYEQIIELKEELMMNYDNNYQKSTETKFLFDSIERKASKKLINLKRESKNILISKNIEKKIKFIENLEAQTPKAIYDSLAIFKIKHKKSSIPILIKICIEEEQFLTQMIALLNKHTIHTDKLEMLYNEKKIRGLFK